MLSYEVATHKDAEESEKQHEENGEAWRAVSLGQIGPETECVGTSLPLLYTTIGPEQQQCNSKVKHCIYYTTHTKKAFQTAMNDARQNATRQDQFHQDDCYQQLKIK